MPQCKCAGIGIRVFAGTTDYKVMGDPKCGICRGSGFFDVCPQCEGAGIFESKLCFKCGGKGKIRLEPPAKPFDVKDYLEGFQKSHGYVN